ncbi:MAG: thiamine phosphate synthase [Rubellimicrobium sp.]|nr:thiamine phosphate synthase [Rubellimicrobium sp.]
MTDTGRDLPQLYLVTPADPDRDGFADLLARALDAVPVACLRLSMATTDEDRILRAGDALREIAHARDVPLVIERHALMVERLGLDGVHLGDGARQVAKLRKTLGPDAIIGAFCGQSRHEGLSAGEAGADYIAFGPAGITALGDGAQAGHDLFAWWSEMVEVPVVAEGALDPDLLRALAPVVDFVALGDEIWGAADPLAALRRFAQALGPV